MSTNRGGVTGRTQKPIRKKDGTLFQRGEGSWEEAQY